MARWPVAIWQPGAPCGGTLKPISVCLHHQAGNGNPINVYKSRNVSAHFWLPRAGTPYQHVDTSVRAWHGVAHNGYSIGVETEGCGAPPHADPLTEHQVNTFAELMKWANKTHGVPLVTSEVVSQPGLNYHRCQGGPATGCPCDVRKNARGEILRRAQVGTAPPLPAPRGGHDVFIKSNDGKTYWLIYAGVASYWREVPAPMVGTIPAAQVIDDRQGTWKALWKVGAGP